MSGIHQAVIGSFIFEPTAGLFTWGSAAQGELGHNKITGNDGFPTANKQNVPDQLGGSEWDDARSISTVRGFTGIVKSDGTLWTMGNNQHGQLGIGNTVARSSPVQVGALTNWNIIQTAENSFRAIKTDGTMWSWGRNNRGQLGINADEFNPKSSPVQIGALTTWAALGRYHAIKTDGTLWAWGFNSQGRLGLNDTANRSSPVQVGALTNWESLSPFASFAKKTDGSIWSWGSNNRGQLGHNVSGAVNPSRSSPTQIGALTNWTQVSYASAIKTAGTLWKWGSSDFGNLGNGLFYGFDRSSPVQLGSDTWQLISCDGRSNLAIKTAGTLWGWGNNVYGQLGVGYVSGGSSNQGVSAPIQVGTVDTWYLINSGFGTSIGVRD